MTFPTLRHSLAVTTLLVAGMTSAQATTVALDEVGAFSGLGAIVYDFTTTVTGTYDVNLYDLGALVPGSATPFTALHALINPVNLLVETVPGAAWATGSFFALAGTSFTALVSGYEPDGLLSGKYAINVQSVASASPVPLPMPLLLLGSALTGVLALRRRQAATI